MPFLSIARLQTASIVLLRSVFIFYFSALQGGFENCKHTLLQIRIELLNDFYALFI